MLKPITMVASNSPSTDGAWSAQDYGSPPQNWDMIWDPRLVRANSLGGVNLRAVLNPEGSSHTYGVSEIRSTESFDDVGGYVFSFTAKLPAEHPPGVVMAGFTYPQRPGSAGSEMDFEFLNGGLAAVLHQYDGTGPRRSTSTVIELGFDPSDDFHTYQVALRNGVATWLVDGQVVQHVTAADTGRAFINGTTTAYLSNWVATGAWAGEIDKDSLPVSLKIGGADFRSGSLRMPDLHVGTHRGEALAGDAGNDQIFGKGGGDALRGHGWHDRLMGEDGSDWLHGGSGNDILVGGAGADRIIGGAGHDILWGDWVEGPERLSYADTFVFLNAGQAADRIGDFEHGDRIDLSRIDANSNRAGDQTFRWGGTTPTKNGIWVLQDGSDVIVRMDTDGDLRGVVDLRLLNVDLAEITARDFLL